MLAKSSLWREDDQAASCSAFVPSPRGATRAIYVENKVFFFLSEIVHLVDAGSFVCLENSEVGPPFILGSVPFHPTV